MMMGGMALYSLSLTPGVYTMEAVAGAMDNRHRAFLKVEEWILTDLDTSQTRSRGHALVDLGIPENRMSVPRPGSST
jgi:hypothetical protein